MSFARHIGNAKVWGRRAFLGLTLVAALPTLLRAQQPTLTSVFPHFLYQGTNASRVLLFGSNFQQGVQCDFGANITVNSCVVNSDAQLTANLSVSSSASAGDRDVTVKNPGGETATISSGVNVGAPPYPIQKAVFSFQPTSSGTVTVVLPGNIHLGDALLIGLSFFPADVTSVVVGEPGFSYQQPARRGLADSIYHGVSRGPLYTNYYYLDTGYQGCGCNPGTITINFSGGPTYAFIAVAEVKGTFTAGDSEALQFAYNESTTPTASWADAITPEAFNEYFFAWGATRNVTSCASPASGWTIEDQTNVPAGGTICLLDATLEPPGLIDQASAASSTPEDYVMGMIAYDYYSLDPTGPSPPNVSSVDPDSGSPGQNLSNMIISGSSFDTQTYPYTGFVCTFGADIAVNTCSLDSASELSANISLGGSAPQGPRNVTVTNFYYYTSYGSTLANAFSVAQPPAPNDFRISLAPPIQSALPGGTASYPVNLTAGSAFDGPISLTCSGLPPGMSCSAPAPVTPTSAGKSATVTLQVNDNVAPSTTPGTFTINATSGTLSHTVQAQIAVAALTATISPSSASINVGSSANFSVSLTATNGFAGPVSLSCEGAPAGTSCSFSSAQLALSGGGGSSTLTVKVSSPPTISILPRPGRDAQPASRELPLATLGVVLFAALALGTSAIIIGFSDFRSKNLSSWSRALHRLPTPRRKLPVRIFSFAAVLLLAIVLVSCSGATKTSGNGDSGPGGGNSASFPITVEAQSGGATVNLGTVSIAVP